MRKRIINRLFVLVVSLLTASGTFKALNHDTTALLLFIAALVLFFITAVSWAERLISKKLTQNKSTADKLPDAQPEEPKPTDKPQIAKPPSPPTWTEYRQDVFNDIIWRWHYKADIDNSPRDLTPHCPECEKPNPLDAKVVTVKTTPKKESSWLMLCLTHKRAFSIPAEWGPKGERFMNVINLIRQKLQDGTWVEVVNRQRAARNEPPIPLSSVVSGAGSAANAELTVARIAKRLEHCRIEPVLSEKALRVLQAGPKGTVEIVYLGSDSEAWTLAIDFVHLMNRADWNLIDSPKGLATILDLGVAPFGITIQARMIDGDSGDVILYETLVHAIAEAGFNSAGDADASLPAGRCRIIVGPKETGRLEIETAAQRERAADAEKALLELQERTKHRKLTTAQRSQLVALLKRGPVSSVTVEGISGDSEVSNFCHDLGSALEEGGFNLIAYGERSQFENFSGLKVLAVTIEDPAAIALHKSLNEVGLSASLELNPEHLVDPKMPRVPSWFFDENDPGDRLVKQTGECNVLWVGFKP